MKWEFTGDEESGGVWYTFDNPEVVVEVWVHPENRIYLVTQSPKKPTTRLKCDSVEAAKAIAVLMS